MGYKKPSRIGEEEGVDIARGDAIIAKFFPTGAEVLEECFPPDPKAFFNLKPKTFLCGACEESVHEIAMAHYKNTNEAVAMPFCDACHDAFVYSPKVEEFKTWVSKPEILGSDGFTREGHYQTYFRLNPLAFTISKTKRTVE